MRSAIVTTVLVAGFAALMASLAVPAVAADGEWPCWRGPNHDGKSPDKGLLKEWPAEGPKELWKVTDLGKGFSSVTISGGQIYTTGNVDGKLIAYAYDMDGKLKWQSPCGGARKDNHPGSESTPTVDGDNLYVLTDGGTLTCLDTKAGKSKWTKEMKEFGGSVPGWGYSESPLVLDNMLIVTPGGKSCIVALEKATGKGIWASTGFSAGAHYGSCIPVTVGKTTQIVAGTGGGIVGVDAKTGNTLWSNKFSAGNTANCPTPAFADGMIFWANGYGKGGIALKLGEDGKATEAWTTKDMDCHHGGYIIEGGCIYGNNGGGWACLDLKTGQKKWSAKGVGKGSITFADGMLYLFGENGGQVGLATCSPEGLQMKGQFKVKGSGESWAHPVVIGGKMYIRYDTNLYCFDVKNK